MPADGNVFNQAWAPDPMQGPELIQKFANIQGTNLQNRLTGQGIQKAEMENQVARAKLKLGDIVAKNSQSGTPDWLAIAKDTAQDPETANPMVHGLILDMVNNQLQQTPAGLNPDKSPRVKSLQSVNKLLGTPNSEQSPQGQAVQQPAELNPIAATASQKQPQSQIAVSDNPPIEQEHIDNAHDHHDELQNSFKGFLEKPDSDMTLDNLHQMAYDLVSNNIANKNRGVPANMVAAEMSGPDFPREGPNGEPPAPQAIRQYVQKHYLASVGEQGQINHQLGSHSRAMQQQQPAGEEPGTMTTGLSPGFAKNQAAQQEHYQSTLSAADPIRIENAALGNVLNISKSNIETGTKLSKIYDALAKTGLVPEGLTDPTVQRQKIQAHLAQIATANMPSTNEKLHAIQDANMSGDQLAETIQGMIPYLIGINNSKLAQANYYQKQDPTGADPEKIAQARSVWQNAADPRAFEYESLSPIERKKYADTLSPAEAAEISHKRKLLQKLGAFDAIK